MSAGPSAPHADHLHLPPHSLWADEPPPLLPRRRWWQHPPQLARLLLAVAAAATLTAAASWLTHKARRSRSRSKKTAEALDEDDDGVRIPLRDVVRFKEKQWFVEELEASREGDANAMLRLAKMYLHGQGCDKNPAMAHEWLRKARYLGVFCTLEELYAGEDWEATRAASAAAARRALKQELALQQRGLRQPQAQGAA